MLNQKASQAEKIYKAGNVSLHRLTSAAVDEGYLQWINDPEINGFLESRFNVWSRDTLVDYIDNINRGGREWLFGVFHDDVYIGNIKLGPIEHHHGRASVGIILGNQAYHGRGIGTIAVNLIKEFAFQEMKIRKLTAGCYAENMASLSLFKKSGFFVEAKLERHVIWQNKECDVILMGCFRSDN